MEIAFWALAGLVTWSLFGYGLVWIMLARFAAVSGSFGPERALRAVMLIAARNEAGSIRNKIESVLAQDLKRHTLDILVVSDGSEDATVAEVRGLGREDVRVVETPGHVGKATALDLGLARIGDDVDVVILSDANSMLAPGALHALLAPFADPKVGGVCGRPEPLRRSGGWIARAEGLFWVYDSALKEAENRLGGAVSAQGALYAMRRALMPTRIPSDVADDFFISVRAVDLGYRLAFARDAVAREEVTTRTRGEMMRRVRSTERGWRALMAYARLLNPFRTGLYAAQLVSHKLLRRCVAFVLPPLLAISLGLSGRGVVYDLAAVGQLGVYGLALSALVSPQLAKLPGAGAAAFFVMGHAAMAFGILRAAFGVRSARWTPLRSDA